MGMFDTFYGEYTCPKCGNETQFEEQTKDYECILEDFFLGDYVDRGNRNYLYDFRHFCPNCHTENEVYIAIRRGQYVGVFIGSESSEIEVTKLDNIEDGYARNRLYEQMCERKLGYENPYRLHSFLEQKHVGEHFIVLGTDWKVLEVYHEEFDYDKYDDNLLRKSFYDKENFIYRVVSDEGDKRIISVRKHRFTHEIYMRVSLDDLSPERETKYAGDDKENIFIMQTRCKLVRIE